MKSHRCRRPSAGHIALWILLGLAAIAAFPFFVQQLWNHVLVEIVSVNPITYWQAFGLLLLSKLLFGGFPGGRGGCCPSRRHRGPCGPDGGEDDDEGGESGRWVPGGRDGFRREMRRHFNRDDDASAQP